MSSITNIFQNLKKDTIVQQTIYLLIAVFLVFTIFIQFTDFGYQLLDYLGLSSDSKMYLYRPYTFISYTFIHVDFIHFIMNILVLYYVGNLFLDFFTKKQFILYFLFGAVFGGLFFIAFYSFFTVDNILIGTSASITALLIGAATKEPSYEINFRFIGFVKLYIVAVVWILLSVMLLAGNNVGGQIAHLGGAFIGFILTKYLSETKNDFSFKKKKKTHLKTVFKKSDYGLSNYQKDKLYKQKINFLLDKISKSGYNSLTQAERDFLSGASKK